VVCNISVTSTGSSGLVTGDICGDFGYPEVTRKADPTQPSHNYTCNLQECSCLTVPAPSYFNLLGYVGVSLSLVVHHGTGTDGGGYGLFMNSTCLSGTCNQAFPSATPSPFPTTIPAGGGPGGIVLFPPSLATANQVSSSSSHLGLILGLTLGLGIPLLLLCLVLIIVAIVAAILCLGKGGGAKVKTFWVPNRDGL